MAVYLLRTSPEAVCALLPVYCCAHESPICLVGSHSWPAQVGAARKKCPERAMLGMLKKQAKEAPAASNCNHSRALL